jgi:hypothetical protein
VSNTRKSHAVRRGTLSPGFSSRDSSPACVESRDHRDAGSSNRSSGTRKGVEEKP